MAEDRPYRLIPERIPRPKARRGVYEEIVDDFIASDEESVRVEYGQRHVNTIFAGLYHALRQQERDDVQVRRRKGAVYLLKKR